MSTIPPYGVISNIPMTKKRRKILGKLLNKIIQGDHFYPKEKNEFHHIFYYIDHFKFDNDREELLYKKLIATIAFDSSFPSILLDKKWLIYFYEYTRSQFKLSLCLKFRKNKMAAYEMVYKRDYAHFTDKIWELVSMILCDLFRKDYKLLMVIRKNKGWEIDPHVNLNLFPFWLYRNHRSIYDAIIKADLKYVLLEDISMEQIVQYLPGFVLEKFNYYLNNLENQHIVRHLALGKNIRKVNKLPFNLSKKMAHQFHQVSSNDAINARISEYNMKFPLSLVRHRSSEDALPFNEPFVKAFVLGLGGDPILAKEFAGVYDDIDDYEFQKSIVGFFVKFPISNVDTLRRLLGYINHMRHENRQSYSLKGRNLSSITRAANAYYEEQQRLDNLRRSPYNYWRKDISWKGADYSPYCLEENNEEYKIIQLCRAEDLYFESQRMNHCVRTYVGACLKGNCSIWSLRLRGVSEWKSLVTIEVSNAKRIVQAKARFNYKPDGQWMTMIKEWAEKEGLVFGKKW